MCELQSQVAQSFALQQSRSPTMVPPAPVNLLLAKTEQPPEELTRSDTQTSRNLHGARTAHGDIEKDSTLSERYNRGTTNVEDRGVVEEPWSNIVDAVQSNILSGTNEFDKSDHGDRLNDDQPNEDKDEVDIIRAQFLQTNNSASDPKISRDSPTIPNTQEEQICLGNPTWVNPTGKLYESSDAFTKPNDSYHHQAETGRLFEPRDSMHKLERYKQDKRETSKDRKYKIGSVKPSNHSEKSGRCFKTSSSLQSEQSRPALSQKHTEGCLTYYSPGGNVDKLISKRQNIASSADPKMDTPELISSFHRNSLLDLHSLNTFPFGVPSFLQSSCTRTTNEMQNDLSKPHNYGDFSSQKPISSINGTLPPMFTAAAMAAITGCGGGLPTSSTMENLGPLFASACNHIYSADCIPDEHTRVRLSDDSLLPPMRVMYNTSKLLFGKNIVGCRDLGETPPPPSLSTSTSPRTQSPRLLERMDEAYGNVDADADEEDIEEEDMESLTPENNLCADGTSTNTGGQQWTFEEQFKQLYVLSDDPKRKEFLDELFSYMQRRGTPVNRIPIMAKQVLDLYELFQLVVARGGLVEVINKKLWREITKGLNLPSSITSAAFTLRTQYMKYLYPYECETLGLSAPNELQAAIDGNRREARRSSYSFDYPMMLGPNGPGRNLSPTGLIGGHPTCTTMTSSLPGTPLLSANTPNSSSSSFPPTASGGSNLPSGVPNFHGVSLPFTTNNGIGLPAQFSNLHPLFGLSSAGFPTGLPFSHHSTGVQLPSHQSNFFSSNLMSSMPLSSTCLPFLSGQSDEVNIKPATGSSSTNLLPAIPNSFAAAAATLFGAGLTQLPGAFATAPPHHSAQTTPTSNSNVDQINCQQTSPLGTTCNRNLTTSLLTKQNQIKALQFMENSDTIGSNSSSVSPLNLVANEEDNQHSENSRGNDGERCSASKAYDSSSAKGDQSPRSQSVCSSKMKKGRTRSPDRKRENDQKSDDDDDHGKHIKDNNEAENSKWINSSTVSLYQPSFSKTKDYDDLEEKAENLRSSCANTATTIHNETHRTTDTSINHRMPCLGPEATTYKSSSNTLFAITAPSCKRSSQHTPSDQETPPAKHLRFGALSDGHGRRTTGGHGQLRKHSVEPKKSGDANTPNMPQNPSHTDNCSQATFSMAQQNLRLQTQSGAPMGLPSNSMIVTMEFGGVLYQGVLFGQPRR